MSPYLPVLIAFYAFWMSSIRSFDNEMDKFYISTHIRYNMKIMSADPTIAVDLRFSDVADVQFVDLVTVLKNNNLGVGKWKTYSSFCGAFQLETTPDRLILSRPT